MDMLEKLTLRYVSLYNKPTELRQNYYFFAELKSREAEVKIPEFLTILREVTGNKAYSNAGMSRAFPEEIIKMP